MIPENKYIRIIEVLPILCVDLVIANKDKQYLLVKRTNEPYKGQWWVVGGRVQKGETVMDAAVRKAKEELSSEIHHIRPIGFFEAPFQKHPFGRHSTYHALSIVLSAAIDENQIIKLDAQSSEWRFSNTLPTAFKVQGFNPI